MTKGRLVLANQNEELQKQLTVLYSKTWLDEKYKYVHQHYFQPLTFTPNGFEYEQYAVLSGDCDAVLGYLDIRIDTTIHAASLSLAINFTDDSYTMIAAFKQIIETLFKRNFNKISWSAIDGNPIIKSYQKIAEKYGGRQESHERRCRKLWDGTVADAFTWGILKEEYERTIKCKK